MHTERVVSCMNSLSWKLITGWFTNKWSCQPVEIPFKQESRRKKHGADMHADGKACGYKHPVQIPHDQQLTRWIFGSFRFPSDCNATVLETTSWRTMFPSTAGLIQFPATGCRATATFTVLSAVRTTSSEVSTAEDSLS